MIEWAMPKDERSLCRVVESFFAGNNRETLLPIGIYMDIHIHMYIYMYSYERRQQHITHWRTSKNNYNNNNNNKNTHTHSTYKMNTYRKSERLWWSDWKSESTPKQPNQPTKQSGGVVCKNGVFHYVNMWLYVLLNHFVYSLVCF